MKKLMMYQSKKRNAGFPFEVEVISQSAKTAKVKTQGERPEIFTVRKSSLSL